MSDTLQMYQFPGTLLFTERGRFLGLWAYGADGIRVVGLGPTPVDVKRYAIYEDGKLDMAHVLIIDPAHMPVSVTHELDERQGKFCDRISQSIRDGEA